MEEYNKSKSTVWQDLEFYKFAARSRGEKNAMLTQQVSQLTQQKADLTEYSQSLLTQLTAEKHQNRKLRGKIKKYMEVQKELITRRKSRSISSLTKKRSSTLSVSEEHSGNMDNILPGLELQLTNELSFGDGADDYETIIGEDYEKMETETLQILEKLEQETQKLIKAADEIREQSKKTKDLTKPPPAKSNDSHANKNKKRVNTQRYFVNFSYVADNNDNNNNNINI
ncbi:hypothetical protein RFI_24658 [Reticulomyxa filosa]|uniref:Uncharacterized protein n=1 Tax=Reticulomyxa filosa TaxID=46433 RepID=X6MFN0_RETFI|nr:hypothetical protein RFI_24658 [Reticulomyxa filosa]|eukprot:ETO12714.1 hypothetical protein RFI_24658 [Reticulomyxa filosa]